MHDRRSFSKRLATAGLTAALATLLLGIAAQPAAAQYEYNPEHRRPVERTINDLREVANRYSYRGEDGERCENAIRHLRHFEEKLHERGSFDKDELDDAIGDVQKVADHNHMDPEAREFLRSDANELRRLREHYDERYQYRERER